MSASTLHTRRSWLAPAILAPLGVTIAIVGCGIWLSLPELAVLRGAGNDVDDLSAATAAPAITDARRAPVDISALGNSLLFGIADPTSGTADAGADSDAVQGIVTGEDVPADLPVAALPVSVQGIVFDPGSASGRVIFGGTGGDMRSFRVGDTLPDGVTIRFIESHRVVVEQAGELKALLLPTAHGGVPLVREAPAAVEFEAAVMPDDSSYELDGAAMPDDSAYELDGAVMPDDSSFEQEYDPDSLEPEYE